MKFWSTHMLPGGNKYYSHGDYCYYPLCSTVYKYGKIVASKINNAVSAQLAIKDHANDLLLSEVMEWNSISCYCHTLRMPPCWKCENIPSCEYHECVYVDCDCHAMPDVFSELAESISIIERSMKDVRACRGMSLKEAAQQLAPARDSFWTRLKKFISSDKH